MEAQRSYEELINNDAINSAKTGMQFAVDKQPDAEARLQSLAKQYSLPVDAVRLDPKAIERKSQLDAVDYESLVKTAPHTNYLLSDPNKAAIAHDDIDNLSQIEGGLKALRGPEPNALNIASGLLSNLSIAPLHSAIKVAFHDAFFDDGSTTAQVRHNDLLRKSLQQKDALDNTTPDFETDTAQGIYSGAASFMQALPGMAASVATANPLPMIASAGVQQGFPAYGKYLDRGATKSEAALGAVGEGSAEMGFEALPMGFIVKKFGKAGAGEFLTGLLAREIPSEQATTLAQDAIDTAIANPDKSWGDFVNERPDAAYQTLLATVTQGGITGAISSIAKRMTEQGKRVDSANLVAVNIEKLNQLAAASKVLARSPDTIKTFAEAALADSPVQDLYIDAQTFLQSGVAEHVAALLPDVAEQLKEALPGAEIRIPISDYLAHIASTDYATTLKDHLRLEGDDYSPAQAQSYMQTHAEEMQHEIDTILTGHQQADSFRTSQDAVKATVLDQLNKLNRFSSTKNELDATLISARMAVRAAQLGITPEQMYEKQTPNFAAESVGGGMVYGQTEKTAETVTARWQKALSRIKDPNFEPNFDTPLAIKHMGVVEKFLPFPVKVMKQVLSKHKDLPVGVVANLPTLLADPLFIFPHKDGGIRVVINAKTDKGEPIVVGIGNGRIKTITPIHHGEDINGTERLNNQFRSALQAGEKVYARNENALTEAKAFDLAPVGHNYQGRYNKSKKRITTNDDLVKKYGDSFYQQQYGSFHPPTNTIAIFKQGNLSTVLHELGHFFFENDIALAAELFAKPELTAGEQQIVSDVSALLNWSGIQGTLEEQLDQWYSMDIEEKRGAHERTAEAFEAYLFSGKAPSIELQHAFQTFRTWLISVYKSLKDFLASHPEAGKLNEEVSAIFDRMLATEEEIKLAEKARSLMPLFESAQKAGMSEADFAAYQALGVEATNTAIDALQAKALGDMEWMGRAHTKYLKALQKKHDELRRELRSQARTDIMAQPVYRAYSFLTGKLNQDDKIAQHATAKSNPKHVDPSIDSLFVAIAKLGGLQRGQLSEEWNYDHQGRVQMPVFGKPVVRKNGGLSIETMAESLMDEGYLNMDEHGKYDLHEFEEKFSAELRGVAQYAHSVDYGNITQEDHKAGEAVINPEGLGAGRFELSELRGMGLPEAVLNLMINLKMTAKDGLHPDIVSDLFGFSSGDELVNALASAENPKAAIEHLTDQRMLQEHGELATPEAVEEAADRAVHNKFRERLLRSEANALAKATGSLRLLGNAAKEYTQAMINRLKVRDIKPINYSRAEVRAARAAEQAHRKGDTEQAAIEKRNQVLNMQAFRAAVAAQDHIDKMLRYFKRLGGDGQKIDAEYIDVIRGMLDKFDLRDQSGKHLDEQARLRTWVQSQLAEGQLPVIAESLLSPQERAAYTAQVESRDEHGELIYQDDEEALKLLSDAIDRSAKRSYKDATYEELQGLYETIKQMEHLGRLKHKLLTAQDERDADAIYTEMIDGIILHGGAGGKNTRTPNDVLGKMLAGIKDFGSAHIKIATWARIMDGGIDNGPVWRFLVKPANARATQETTMKAAATKELDAIMRPILAKATLRDKSGKGKYFASIGTSLNWQERFSFLLNMGNESNLQRLMGGGIATVKENLTMAQLLEVVGTLSWDEALAVQKIWDHFESYRPLIAEKEKRISGVEPQWVTIRPIDIKVNDGRVITLQGGYYPVKFDPRVNRMAEAHASAQDAKNLMKASYSAATTNRSFIKQRVEEVTGRPLLLNLTGLYSGVNDVIHDLAWHEWVIDANKILKKIDPAIREFYGADVKKQFDTWRNDIVVGQRKLDHGIEKAAAFARQYVSASALTFNLMSAAMQPLGIANTMARIGAHWVGQGIAIYAANPLQATKDAQQKSEWLRNRTRTRFRELNELRNQVQGQTAAKELMGRYGYWLMMRAQMMVDIPSWHGGYEKAIAQGFDEDTAIALADQAVKDSQGGGEEVDQSGIERGHALVKLFTAFYGFMGTTLNTAYGSTITEKSKAKIAANLLLTLSVPAVLGSLLRSALTPGDDDDENLAETLIREQLAFVMGLIAFGREFAGITKDNHMGYSGPTGLRLIPDTFKLADQIKQGDFDTAFRKQFVNVLGDISGLPAVQINRTWTGIEALNEGKTTNPAAIGFGFAKNH